jgi:hypothetical protein
MPIHEIFVWIRIRGSIPHPDPISYADPDADPAIFVSDLQDVNKKIVFFKVFLLITI